MLNLLQMALAPVIIVCFYVYIRDKYEKEPIRLLLLGVFFGLLISAPIMAVENLLTTMTPNKNFLIEALYTSFIVASGTEELFKFIILYFLVWKNKNFNEPFDGIVYAVFISLGFAGIENVLYIFNPYLGGYQTAIARAIFSVPGHGLFGVSMGYYYAIAKFNKKTTLVTAFLVPWLFHGIYDFILISNISFLMIFFVPFVLYLWIQGMRKIKEHIQQSPFKPKN
ncbi:MAG: PrsW family intramembrane metalloprotease [Epulopiscium sp.]|nr:PrsW family intramembrane metalloprotease [Candidatus Epulonipiscium sp.]